MYQFTRSETFGPKPVEVEVTRTCVLVRMQFSEVEQVGQNGDHTGVTGWTYLEARMSHGEYAAYAAEMLGDDADAISGGLVEVAELAAENSDMVEVLAGAVAELAEIVAGGE